MEVQKHVGLLEAAKKQLSRLVGVANVMIRTAPLNFTNLPTNAQISTAATSTVDFLCIGLVTLDTRLKLVEDKMDEGKVRQERCDAARLSMCFLNKSDKTVVWHLRTR